MKDIIGELRNILGNDGLLTGSDVSDREIGFWHKGSMEALAIARPGNTREVAAVLQACNGTGRTVIAQGGRTGLAEAHLTTADDVVISLERMNRIEELDQAGRTMTVIHR